MPNNIDDLLAAEARHQERVERARRASEIQAWVRWPAGGQLPTLARGESAHAHAVARPFTVDEYAATRHALERAAAFAEIVALAHQIVEQDSTRAHAAVTPTAQTTAPDSAGPGMVAGVESGALNSEGGA